MTIKKLDTIFAKFVKELYPLHCHACFIPLVKGQQQTQACHFIQRGKHITRFDPRNVLPGCGPCNGFDPTHVYQLGLEIDKYWGEGTALELREMKNIKIQFRQDDLESLASLFHQPYTLESKDLLLTNKS